MRHPAAPCIAIIDAHMAGITCARTLQKMGCSSVVLEKSRGIGGRLATRRTAEGDCFDHGASYITARGPSLQQMLEPLSCSTRPAHDRRLIARDAPHRGTDGWSAARA